MRRTAAQIEQDARGIVDPHMLADLVQFTRYAPGAPLDALVDRFWAVRWEFPDGRHHDQRVLTHPCGNLIVTLEPDGRLSAVLSGPARRVTTRRLSGTGWAVAAMTTPGGLGGLLPGRADAVTDRVLPLGPAMGAQTGPLLDGVAAAPHEAARVAALERWLTDLLQARPPERLAAAGDVVRIARLAEHDLSLRRLDDLARAAGTSPRTLQRMFRQYVGVSPTWVLRRYRLLEVTERARAGRMVSWVRVATDLGYADQAHLVRDVKAHLGTTPAAYAARLG